MFEYLANFQKILVTGPQRSGTTICAKMIAHDLKTIYVDERRVIRGRDKNLPFHEWLKGRIDTRLSQEVACVLHCPPASSFCHEFDPEMAIVFMIRPIEEIIASQNRIGWKFEQQELSHYGTGLTGPIAKVKYEHWQIQKQKIKNWFEVNYHSLSKHELWVSPEHRQNFAPRQTRIVTHL
jgi:hypothetical protein